MRFQGVQLSDLFNLKQMIKGLLLNVPHREHVVIDTKCSHPSSVYPRETYNILPSLAKRELKCGDQLKNMIIMEYVIFQWVQKTDTFI